MDLENVRPSWIRIWAFRGVPGFPQEITENERDTEMAGEKDYVTLINTVNPKWPEARACDALYEMRASLRGLVKEGEMGVDC